MVSALQRSPTEPEVAVAPPSPVLSHAGDGPGLWQNEFVRHLSLRFGEKVFLRPTPVVDQSVKGCEDPAGVSVRAAVGLHGCMYLDVGRLTKVQPNDMSGALTNLRFSPSLTSWGLS
jgi:hypothetical protein